MKGEILESFRHQGVLWMGCGWQRVEGRVGTEGGENSFQPRGIHGQKLGKSAGRHWQELPGSALVAEGLELPGELTQTSLLVLSVSREGTPHAPCPVL